MNGRNGSQAASSSGDELSQTQGLFIVHKVPHLCYRQHRTYSTLPCVSHCVVLCTTASLSK